MEINKEPIELIAKGIADKYREILAGGNMNASWNLSKAHTTVDVDGTKVNVYINLQPYWWWVETGRMGYGPDAPAEKKPPIGAIKKWIEDKPVTITARNGKIPSTTGVAHAIAWKIAREGIPGRRPLDKTLQSPEFESIMQQIEIEILKQLKAQLFK